MAWHELPFISDHSCLLVHIFKDKVIRSVLMANLGNFCCTEYSGFIIFFKTHS